MKLYRIKDFFFDERLDKRDEAIHHRWTIDEMILNYFEWCDFLNILHVVSHNWQIWSRLHEVLETETRHVYDGDFSVYQLVIIKRDETNIHHWYNRTAYIDVYVFFWVCIWQTENRQFMVLVGVLRHRANLVCFQRLFELITENISIVKNCGILLSRLQVQWKQSFCFF